MFYVSIVLLYQIIFLKMGAEVIECLILKRALVKSFKSNLWRRLSLKNKSVREFTF
jgi:hypothetical protein